MPTLPNIYLIGPMGAGKTTVGRRLATRLGRRFMDTDQCIEQSSGASIHHIFEVEGETGFRRREAHALAVAGCTKGCVIATGGGAILCADNRRVIRGGTVVYLRAPLELLCLRLRSDRTRPLLGDQPRARIAELLAVRAPLYTDEADVIIDVEGSAQHMAAQIHARLP